MSSLRVTRDRRSLRSTTDPLPWQRIQANKTKETKNGNPQTHGRNEGRAVHPSGDGLLYLDRQLHPAPESQYGRKLDWRTASRRDHGLRHSGFAPAGLSYSPDGLLGIDHRSGYLAAGLPGRRLGHPLYEAGRVPAHHDAGACLLRPVARQGYRRL